MTVSLSKMSETVMVSLAKKTTNPLPRDINVTLALDVSGSMRGSFISGEVTELMRRILAVSNVIDDDGILNFYLFDEESYVQDSIDVKEQYDYIENIINLMIKDGHYWSGTNFAPVLKEIYNDLLSDVIPKTPVEIIKTVVKTVNKTNKTSFLSRLWNSLLSIIGLGNKKSPIQMLQESSNNDYHQYVPTIVNNQPEVTKQLILLITDGDNYDKTETNYIIEQYRNVPNVYLQCIDVGHSSPYLKKLAENNDFIGYATLDTFSESDEKIIDALVSSNVLQKFGKV